MESNKENIKIGLLGAITLILLVNTYYVATKGSSSFPVAPTAGSSAVQTPANNQLPAINNANPTSDISTVVDNTTPTEMTTPPSNQKMTRMTFGQYLHDFGTIKQNSTNTYKFKFTNTGDEPLLITNAVGSCGCTVPNYPKEPIAPGKSATIDVEYKPGTQSGAQDKKVTVTANTDPNTTTLTIKANVIPE